MMLKALFHRSIRGFERMFGYDAGYMHEVTDASASAMFKFSLLQPMTQHRDGVPKDAWYAAKIAGALAEDCGPCTQLCVDMATRDGVAPDALAALLRGDMERTGADASLGFRYGTAMATNASDLLELVDQARVRYGERGLVSLAFVVTTARMYPTLKRGLGHGMACTKIAIAGQSIAVKHAA
jgi:hypothetical protein